MEFDLLLRLVGLMNLIPILCHLINIQETEPSLGGFVYLFIYLFIFIFFF